jgi:YHS domain-containing protein
MTVPQLGPTIQFSHSGRLVENSRQQIPVHNHSCSKVTQTDGIVSFPILHGPSAGPARHNGGVMPKTYVLLVLAVVLAAPAAAVAGPGEYQSLDAMGLASGKGMKTPCKVSGDYEGKTYCFRSEDAKAEFMKDAAGNRSKADAYYGGKSSDPNWTPCNYIESPNIPDSCN